MGGIKPAQCILLKKIETPALKYTMNTNEKNPVETHKTNQKSWDPWQEPGNTE